MLRFWRYWVAWTQRQLAAKAGVSSSTISSLECGGRTHAALVQRLTEVIIEEIETPAEWAEQSEPIKQSEPIDLAQPLTDRQRAWLDEQQRRGT